MRLVGHVHTEFLGLSLHLVDFGEAFRKRFVTVENHYPALLRFNNLMTASLDPNQGSRWRGGSPGGPALLSHC